MIDVVAVLIAHPTPDVYGSDLQVLESIRGLASSGYDVHLVLPHNGPLVEKAVEAGAEVRFVGFPALRKAVMTPTGSVRYTIEAAIATMRAVVLLRRLRPQTVYVNTLTIPVWALAATVAGIPSVTHVHEAVESSIRAVAYILAVPLFLSRRIITNSRASSQAILAHHASLEKRTVLIYNGVPDPAHGREHEDLVTESGSSRIILIGRLSPRKGADILLEAVAILRDEGLDVAVSLVGSVFSGYEWYEDQLRRRAAERDLAGAVAFLGYVNPVWPELRRSSVAVVPSREEPFGNVAVEAQLAGVPVVVSDAQGLVEIVDHDKTGLIFPSGNARALADALRRLLLNRLLATELADQARTSAVTRFHPDRYRAEVAVVVAQCSGDTH